MTVNWWYVTSSTEPYPTRALVICALRSMAVRDRLRLTVVRIDDSATSLAARVANGIIAEVPDAVVISDARVRDDPRFKLPEPTPIPKPRAPIFDLGWALGQDRIDQFVLGDGVVRIGLDKDGHLTGTPTGWTSVGGAADWLKAHVPSAAEKIRANRPGGAPSAPPQAHRGAAVAEGGDGSAVVAVICWMVGEAVAAETGSTGAGLAADAICHAALETVDAGVDYVTETVPDLPPSQPAGGVPDRGPTSVRPRRDAGVPPPPQQNEPDEEDGRNLMLLLKEWAEARMFEQQRAWEQITGETGEKSDVRREWTAWLRKEQIPTPDPAGRHDPDDDTGYSFLYWLYELAGKVVTEGHQALKYAWLRGAPIDPARLVRRAVVGPMARTPSLIGHVTSDGALELESHNVPPGGEEGEAGSTATGHHG